MEKAYDRDMSFMLIEVDKNQMYFEVISRTSEVVDKGTVPNNTQKS